MILDTNSDAMKWILTKFFKDSLDFLGNDERAMGYPRKQWIIDWMTSELTDERVEEWMPKDDY
jgi:hypothetical protein